MILASTLDFLKELKQNNNKVWFDNNRDVYEKARKNFSELTEEMIQGISSFDEEIAKAQLNAKQCMFRINRDVRFSQDKSPYKSNFGAFMNAGGKKSSLAGYYFHLEPDNQSFIGGGVYMPMPADLSKIRNHIDERFEDLKKILENKQFTKLFPDGIQSTSRLTKPPKGFESDNPALEFLKMKDYYTMANFSDSELMDSELAKRLLKLFEATKALIVFINEGLQ